MFLSLVIAVHASLCVALCILILLQRGKGADIGAVFGGSSQTVFGSGGAGNLLSRVTWAMAVVFFTTSLYLAWSSATRQTGSLFGSGPSGGVPARTAPARGAPSAPAKHGPPGAPAPVSKPGKP
jgi:preprotein translocase subunit SecG